MVATMSDDTKRWEDFIEAMQSNEVRVVVGERKKVFTVPVDLLSKCSSEFEFMCIREKPEIELPDVNPATFGSFLVWLHSWLPNGIVDDNAEKTVDLAIFAEKYEISALLLQCLHVLKETWVFHKAGHSSQKWIVKRRKAASPQVVSRIFERTKETSALRDMCASFLGGYLHSKKWCSVSIREYEKVFRDLPEVGWRVFNNQIQYRDNDLLGIPQDYQNVYGREYEARVGQKTESVKLGWKNWMEIQETLATEEVRDTDDAVVHDSDAESEYQNLDLWAASVW